MLVLSQLPSDNFRVVDGFAFTLKLSFFVASFWLRHFDKLKSSLGLDVKTRKIDHGEGSRVIP